MELVDVMQSFLPREVLELFEVVKIDDKPSQWRMDIYLDERKVVPEQLDDTFVIAYGFVGSSGNPGSSCNPCCWLKFHGSSEK